MTQPAGSAKRGVLVAAGLVCGIGLLLAVCASCRSIPTDTVEPGTGHDEDRFARYCAVARATFERQPRTIEGVTTSAKTYGDAIRIKSDDYETLWRAARTCAWLGTYLTDDEAREAQAKDGIRYTNTALKLRPTGTEALYYHAVNSGLLGDVSHSYGLDAVETIAEDCRAIIDSGADIDHGGAHRVYGLVLLRAPGPPTSIGSLRNARKQLREAVARAPDWPENHLYLAEAEFEWAAQKDDAASATEARERLEKYLLGEQAKAPAKAQYEFGVWKRKAQELLEANSE